MAFCGRHPTAGTHTHHQHTSIDVELTISARNLHCHDAWLNLHPVCVVYNLPFKRDWQEYGRTKILSSASNPGSFSGTLKVKYYFEECQPLTLKVFDSNGSNQTNSHQKQQEYLGKASCTLGQIVSGESCELALMLDDVQQGQLMITAHEVVKNHEELELTFHANKLKKSGMHFNHVDPFLELFSINNTSIRRSRCLMNTKNHQWPHLSFPVRVLRNERGEFGPVVLRCYDYKDEGEHPFLGEAEIQSKQLLQAPAVFTLKKNNSEKGEIQLISSQMKRVHSFFEYIYGGVQIHCTFAIDLTASNGDPRDPESLHHLGAQPTQYEHLIKAFGDVLQDYNKDQVLSLLGFGARFAPVSHELRVQGIDSVLQAYRKCLETVMLGKTRCFIPPIEHVIHSARATTSRKSYFLLLIMTDGDIEDDNLRQLSKVITEASYLPISVMFVGIGPATFPNLALFNGDHRKLGVDGHDDIRDIVQFALFSDFLSNRDINVATFNLVKQLLANVPDQLVTYMRLNGILP